MKPFILPTEVLRLRKRPGTMLAADLTSTYRSWAHRPDSSIYRLAEGTILIDEGWGAMMYPSEELLLRLVAYDPAAAFTRPFGERAGVEGDQNVAVYLVALPPASITEALRPLAAGAATGVLGRKI